MEPVRVLVKISKETSFYDTAWVNYEDVMSEAIATLKEQGMIEKNGHSDSSSFTALAIDRYDSRILFVFDMYNSEYNFNEAHLEGKNLLPVISMSLSQKGNSVCRLNGPLAHQLNEEIRDLHDLNGDHCKLPFREDHPNGRWPSYPKPRRSYKAIIT